MTALPVTASSLFVVSGGARGVTAHCVIGLARRYHCRFLLLGRSAAGSPPAFVEGCADEATLMRRIAAELSAQGENPTPIAIRRQLRAITAQREIAATLEAVAEAGGYAEYLSVDIVDEAALRAALASATSRLGSITGIIHGAGVLADKRIEQKQAADFDAVYEPKIVGLQNLLSCLPPEHLQHIVLFSSAAGFYGNPGQTDYAIANETLNRAANLLHRRYPHCRTVAFNWGPWDGGMVNDALKAIFQQRGVEVIPLAAGVERLVDELAVRVDHPAQVLVGSPLAPSPEPYIGEPRVWRLHRHLSLDANPFLNDHVIGGHPVLPATCGIAWMADSCERLLPGYRFARCEEYQVLKGIVFDESLAPEYTLTLRELAGGPNGELQFEALVTSEVKHLSRPHYKARVILRPAKPAVAHADDIDLRERDPIDGKHLYESGILFHGPRFHGVERVLNSDKGRLTMRCRLPQIGERDQGQFPAGTLDPYLADVQFQSLVIWARQHYGAASLPLRAALGEVYAAVPPGAPFFATMLVRSNDAYRMVADLTAHDEQGRLYLRLSGAEVAISSHLNRLWGVASLAE